VASSAHPGIASETGMSAETITPLPVCKAILLCETVMVDDSGKINLNGVASNLVVDSGLSAPPTEAFCQITDAIGHYSLVAEVQDLGAGEVIARSPATEIEISDPLQNSNVIISIPSLKFNNLGLHDLVVFANGEEIDRRQFGLTSNNGDSHDLTSQS